MVSVWDWESVTTATVIVYSRSQVMDNKRAVGVFDSGLGGLTVIQDLILVVRLAIADLYCSCSSR